MPAQNATQRPKAPSFDVASIRENKNNDGRWKMEFTQDGLTAMGVSLRYVVKEAYGVYDDKRWLGGPEWMDSVKFNIEAKFDGTEYNKLTLDQRRAMLQALLADRFKLVVHHEMKEFPLYALVVTKNGPTLHERKAGELGHYGVADMSCLYKRSGRDNFEVEGCSMADLASSLTTGFAHDLGRTVIDKTGLTGRYDFALRWATESASVSTEPVAPEGAGPSIFKALPEQLGLRLEPTKGPLDVIVIDRAEMPSEN
ncbi:TIGR03435 family protein [Acidicapsa ligni]|uniref:TIGR03435 family protein n=1 Tax=Acidicapsa ligni TaxID=542300 RepID=UPI0021DF9108|nr:TIGR03435 family protein [Acidicapsa ligni]